MFNTTIALTNQMLARTNWAYARCRVTIDQILENLGESTRDMADHDLATAEYVLDTALRHWDATAA